MKRRDLIAAVVILGFSTKAFGAIPLDAALGPALRSGGLVLVMRHAHAPREAPEPAARDPQNLDGERQLDAAGKDEARTIAEGLRRARVPVAAVLASPTFRARQTAQIAGLTPFETAEPLGDHGASMQNADLDHSAWLRAQAAKSPKPGGNTVIITHMPNIVAAFGAEMRDVEDGEMLVFRPDGTNAAKLIGRIHVQDWKQLAE